MNRAPAPSMDGRLQERVDPRALAQARAQWTKARETLERHRLLSDPHLGLALLERARALPSWRSPAALAGAWFMPHLPGLMGWAGAEARWSAVGVGALLVGLGSWWAMKDAAAWWRWWRARRALAKGRYDHPNLATWVGLNGDITPVPRDGDRWQQASQAAQCEPHVLSVWAKWARGNPPVRRRDLAVLEEAIAAYTQLKSLQREPPLR